MRKTVLSLRTRDYVSAARALGVGNLAIMRRHLLPNALGPLLVAATIGVGGNLLADGQTFLATAPWVAVFPGLALLLAVLAVNLLGDGLRDLLDPRFRE